MASPVVQEVIESSTATAGTSHVVNLPTATAGQLLLVLLDKGSTAATINAHASLTELLDENSANGLYIAYRQMDGTEPASYTLTSSANTRSAVLAYRISGADNPATNPPAIATTATGTSATPDPPSITPPSSKDYLFITFYGAAGEEADDDTWSDTPPTNYTPSPPRMKACGIAGTNLGGMIAAAERQLTTGAAENPGTFAKDSSAAWRAQTILIHPAAPTFSGGDTASLTETFVKSYQAVRDDTLAFTEGFTKLVQRTLADSVVLTESLTAARVVLSDISDTVSLADSLAVSVGKAASETVALAETFVKQTGKSFADTLGLTEGFAAARVTLRSVGDTLGVTEALTKWLGLSRGETVTLTESLDAAATPSGPSYVFLAQVVPVYVHPDPSAPGVVPMAFVSAAPGVTRVHTVSVGNVVAGCVPMRIVSEGIGVVRVLEAA